MELQTAAACWGCGLRLGAGNGASDWESELKSELESKSKSELGTPPDERLLPMLLLSEKLRPEMRQPRTADSHAANLLRFYLINREDGDYQDHQNRKIQPETRRRSAPRVYREAGGMVDNSFIIN